MSAGSKLFKLLILLAIIIFIATGCMSKAEKEEISVMIVDIDKIGEVTLESEALITKIENDFNNLSEKQKKEISNHNTLVNARIELDRLRDEEEQRLETERQRLEEERLRLEASMNACVRVAELISEGQYEMAIEHFNDLGAETIEVGKDRIEEAFHLAVDINRVKGSFDKALGTLDIFRDLALLGDSLSIDESSAYYETIKYVENVLEFDEKYTPYKAAIDLYMSDDVSILTGSIINASKYLEPEKWAEALPFLEQTIAIMNKIDFQKFGIEYYGIKEAEDVKSAYIEALEEILSSIKTADLSGVEIGINHFYTVSNQVIAFNDELTTIINQMKNDLSQLNH
ncbi:MAG TPA: hypothetical protein DCG34_12135 [Clostridiales bacterium]|nr:hypothetical protein [Clostridiales bacterium]